MTLWSMTWVKAKGVIGKQNDFCQEKGVAS